MSEQQVDKASITQIVAETCRQGRIGAVGVARRIARMTGELRSRYAKINGEARQDPPDIWLCDNYYVLEKESKQSRAELRVLRRRMDSAELGLLCAVVERILCAGLPPITDDTAVCILRELSPHVRSGEALYAAFSTAVKAALLRIAHKACFESRDDREIAYAITGFVALPSLDMEEIIGACSGVEKALLRDPAGVYPAMDEDSRRFYRYLLSKIAARERRPEEEVAAALLSRAENATGTRRHVGWWLRNHPIVTAPRRRRGAFSLFCQIALPLLLSVAAAVFARRLWLIPLCYLPFWEILRPLVNQFSLWGVDIDFLPRMDLKKVEDKPKTVVLVSTLLPKTADAPGLAKRLEQLYFSNSDPDMYYCILADFKEADFPADEQDDSQVAASRKVIEALNATYDGRFMLFLRGRVYSKTQKKYSGWERKRGAITEFVRFLGGQPTSVHTFVGDKSVLPKIKFLIALDADTTLLYESAQTLVSVAMHPLNAPVLGEHGVVTEGYGILSPKISIDLTSAKATPFSRVMSGCGGVTAYETRDKDYYQDLFGESIFAGKGLLHVEAFRAALDQRFPENQILSHDILEGSYLRCAFVSDVEMSDGAPPGMTAWLSRLHRWLRGDWQNIVFLLRRYRAGGKLWENPIAPLSRYKLFDNLRRSFSCVVSLACLIVALFVGGRAGAVLSWVGMLSVCFPSLWAAVNSLASGGLFTLSRKFFTRTLPHTMELVAQGCLFLIMLPAQALLTLDAVMRSLWRLMITRSNMLEWTTAAQADSRKMTLRGALVRYGPAELLGLAYLALSRESPLALVGILFVLVLPMAFFTAKPSPEVPHVLTEKDRDTLLSYNAAMWRYYEDFASEQNNYLPPDNIQQSPVYRVATRTSPTNIGMLLLSILAARDMGFIDTGGLYRRVERTLISVEKLRTWNGNLYNWYDTITLEPLRPAFISCVDSGNFICSLVALAEGLREFVPRISGFAGLIARIKAIVDACDLTVFYNKKKHLFSIGYDMESESLSPSHYDFLMSEFRMTSYYAVARKIVGKKHWGSLARTMSRSGSYAGPVSWTGTAFEYFMPQLLLPVYDGSLVGESLTYCLYCQKRRVRGRNIPWGISESAFYAFDNNLNYQYKAHGVQKLGVKRHLDRDLVISPYSTFLTIPLTPNSAMRNLGRLRELGVYGRYGFYEAVDFTGERVGADSLAITRSYMAHHIGMSMVASANALYDNIMQRRFMRDHYMKSAQEFLQEKITKNTVVYDDIKPGGVRPGREDRPRRREASDAIFPQSPRCMILSNGELTNVLTDTGAGYLKFGSIDLTRRGTDLLRRPQGLVALIKGSGGLLPATRAPFYEKDAAYAVEQQEQAVTYRAAGAGLETALRCVIHPTVSCEQRHLTVKTASGRKETVDVLLYLEPVLGAYVDYSAHPAYS
jgi:cyclic beta-1,2-glucan synthetase